MTEHPILGDVLTSRDGQPVLLGSRCGGCGVVAFPRQASCPNCMIGDMIDVELARRGTLWSWTIQGFPPKSPPFRGGTEPFTPFGVGYVELPGEVRVESRLTESDPQRLRIGMEMELVVVPFATDEAGDEVLTFAFAPLEETHEPA